MNRAGRLAVLLLAAFAVAVVLPGTFTGADEEKVVVSRPGIVFHKLGSSDVRGRGVEKTLDAAMTAGYIPCHVCFAREASASRLTSPTNGAAAAATFGHGNVNGHPAPGTTYVQPNGIRIGTLGVAGKHDAVKDPYADLRTIRTPVREQGAYEENCLTGYCDR